MKQEIKKFLKKEGFNFEDVKADKYDKREITEITMKLENEGLIDFLVEERSTESDYWLQVEYYSPKLRKTIIWDYDFFEGEDEDEFINILIETNEAIKKFENKIQFNN